MAKKRGKNLKLIIVISSIAFIIIASFFAFFSSGFCKNISAGYFTENAITGQCIFVEASHCYPWYYKSRCDTTEKKVGAAEKTETYNETINQCNAICNINNSKKYCYVSAYSGVSCNDLVKCPSISC